MDSRLSETSDGAHGAGARRGQVKSRQRVRDLAEVYTHEREVRAMLDLVPGMFPSPRDPGNTDCIFLEPACGNGNFLVEILSRKLRFVTPTHFGSGEDFEHRVLRCLASIYGIDISEDNVAEARERIRTQVASHVLSCLGTDATRAGFRHAVDAILQTNIINADTLADAAVVEMVEYKPVGAGTFMRAWSYPLKPAAAQPSLFESPARRDEIPVHYTDLARQTEPVLAERVKRTAA